MEQSGLFQKLQRRYQNPTIEKNEKQKKFQISRDKQDVNYKN